MRKGGLLRSSLACTAGALKNYEYSCSIFLYSCNRYSIIYLNYAVIQALILVPRSNDWQLMLGNPPDAKGNGGVNLLPWKSSVLLLPQVRCQSVLRVLLQGRFQVGGGRFLQT